MFLLMFVNEKLLQENGKCTLLTHLNINYALQWDSQCMMNVIYISIKIINFLPTAYVVRREVIFSLCVSVHTQGGGVPTFPCLGGGGGYLLSGLDGGGGGGGYLPSQVQGGYLLSGLDGGGGDTYLPRSEVGGYLLSGLDGGGTYLPRSGWGGGYLLRTGWGGGTYLGRYPPT